MAQQTQHSRQVETLVNLLNEIADTHEELLVAIQKKIDAMRTANESKIKAAVERERLLVLKIEEREGLRRQLTENIARGYGIGQTTARRLSAAQLASRIGGVGAGAIDNVAGRLKTLTGQISQCNHKAQVISQNILRHMRYVFSAMTLAEGNTNGYSRMGSVLGGTENRIFDAIG